MNKKIVSTSLLSIFFTFGTLASNEFSEVEFLWEKAESEVLNNNELGLIKKSEKGIVNLNSELEMKYNILSNFKSLSLSDVKKVNSSDNHVVNYGFNILSQEITNYNCLAEGGAFDLTSLSKVIDGKVVTSIPDFNEFFDINGSAGMSGGVGKFSASIRYKKKMTQEFHELSNATTVAFIIKSQTKEKITEAWPELSSRAQRLLNSGTEASKINFRNLCGDAVISSATYGKEMAVLIQVESKKSELQKSKEVAKEISKSYASLVDGSANQSTIDKFRHYPNDFNFKIKAYASGDETVISDTDLLSFKDRLVEFERNDSRMIHPIHYETSEYFNPTNKSIGKLF